MPASAHELDLAALRLSAGEGRRMSLEVAIEPLRLGGERYEVDPDRVGVHLDLSRMTGHGYALALRFTAAVRGACMRCLGEARTTIAVHAREVDQPGSADELRSPYVDHEVLDVAAWAREALVLALPVQVLCRTGCAGLCPVCAANLDLAGPEHHHEREPDPRWAKLGELRLE